MLCSWRSYIDKFLKCRSISGSSSFLLWCEGISCAGGWRATENHDAASMIYRCYGCYGMVWLLWYSPACRRSTILAKTETEGIPATPTGFELTADRERRIPPLHVSIGCKQARISPYTSYIDGRTSLAFCRVWSRPTLYSGCLSQKMLIGWDDPLFLVASYDCSCSYDGAMSKYLLSTLTFMY